MDMHWRGNLHPLAAGYRPQDGSSAGGGCNLLPAWSSAAHWGMYQGEGGTEQGCGPDGTKPASSGERKICQNQVFHFFPLSFPFLFLISIFYYWHFSVPVLCEGSDMKTAV